MNKLVVLLLGLIVIISSCVSPQENKINAECKNIENQYQRDSCYSKIVESKTFLFASCLKKNNNQKNCRDENIKVNLIDSCNKIIDQNKRDLCYNTLVFIYDDSDLCKKVINQNNRNFCFAFKINKLYDCKFSTFPCHLENTNLNLDYCNNFQNNDDKLYCQAIIKEDEDICKDINDSGFRSRCLYAFDMIPNIFDYEKDGRTYTSIMQPELWSAVTWIKNNLPKEVIIVAWWDYGHIIRGVGERNVMVFTPSEEILDKVSFGKKYYFPPSIPTLIRSAPESETIVDYEKWNTKKYGELSKNEDMRNVALILTTTNPKEAINLMKKYKSEYILVTSSEYSKAHAIYNISNVPTEFVDGFTLNKNSILYKMLKLQPIEGFERVYSDNFAVIYKVKS